MQDYEKFLNDKIIIAEKFGFTSENNLTKKLFPHQKDIINFCLSGGRRAIFASFGLGKTFIQLEIAKQCILKENKSFLIVCPLGVAGEFKRDNKKLKSGFDIEYITDTDEFRGRETKIYLTNYERIRKGDINPDFFCGVSFDEASILRNLQTETTNYVLEHFRKLEYRFVATATPTPNDYIEILNYADFLGVISRGHALTRFFQRDSQKAGNLKLYENKKDEFWKWVSTWSVFLNYPSDIGYSDEGYKLPELNVKEHLVKYELKELPQNKYGEKVLFKSASKSLLETSREKRDSMPARIDKAMEILKKIKGNVIVWHSLEAERHELEKRLKGKNYISVFGSQTNPEKEKNLIDFSEGKYKYLLTKSKIAGSGCNFQDACSDMIFVGIDFKFNDFIQSIHRAYRFGQTKPVNVHIIYSTDEFEVMKTLKEKWKKHEELNIEMTKIIKENGFNSELVRSQMKRKMFLDGEKIELGDVTIYNNDCIKALDDIPDNSVQMILTSIPFGNHYEYSDNYNDFGHNPTNDDFFKQMDFLVPKLLRVLDPGRVACIHVKDRIRYSYQNGTSFTTISDFSGQTVMNFEKHGFYLIGKITVTTDVVAENNQTYRLGWTEQCKDASKMGVGLPEYVLIFRKRPTSSDNSYSDNPVKKEKVDYKKALWQLDAHSYQRSNGNRFLTREELENFEVKEIVRKWKDLNEKTIYDFREHLKVCEILDENRKLSSTFMTLPVHSNNENVWSDVNRMRTLNANQVNQKKLKHICPLQFDIIERLINRYSNPGETVLDPFGGLMSTPYIGLKLKRKSIAIELNTEYFYDGLYYIRALIDEMNVPTLFDMAEFK